MRRVLLIMTMATALVSAAGCDAFGGGGEETTQTTVTQSPVPGTGAAGQPSSEPFAKPTVPGQNQARGIVLPDLISSTNPEQRVRQIESNRADPFALIPTTPTIERPPTPPGQGTPVTVSPSRPAATRTTGQAPRTQARSNRGTAPRPGTLAPIPNLVGRAPNQPLVPPRPQPELARAVQVTGVVQIGDTAYAIVNAPNEPTSRYVRVGQRLSNGQVLVRRIDLNAGADPVVVFEQYGVEVVTAVGEGGTPATAGNPVPAAVVPPASNSNRPT